MHRCGVIFTKYLSATERTLFDDAAIPMWAACSSKSEAYEKVSTPT